MENSSLPSHVYQTFIASNNGTVNNSCCASSEMDYTTYCKVALIFCKFLLLFVFDTHTHTSVSSVYDHHRRHIGVRRNGEGH